MRRDQQLTVFILAVVAAAIVVVPLSFWLFPPLVTPKWTLALLTLLALAILGAILALKITEGGTTTSMEFVPQLGAIPILGPFGAIVLTLVTQFFTEFWLLKKPTRKAVFNAAQVSLSVAAGSFLYVLFGAVPSLTELSFSATFPQFLVAVVAYFSVNTITVSRIISLAENRTFIEVWQRTAGSIIVFDLAISPLAYLVSYLYVRWGAVALLAAIVPIIGLRYSYGVNIELQQLNQDLLRVLIKTIEARDKYTSGHSVRVAERARRIAHALRLKPRDTRIIETAALLHDIGKIDLAYGEILRQTGPLTPTQRHLIRSHPDKGVDIIKSVRSLDPEILRCVRHHHEWYNGDGYPMGIAGDAIPLGARIIMVSDSIDAMLTDRPYRAALSVDEVRSELTRNSGTQFDPIIVEIAVDANVLDLSLLELDAHAGAVSSAT
ncbi:MAG: HD-GYP domain-containing protein [Gemmatimonadales bacterium]